MTSDWTPEKPWARWLLRGFLALCVLITVGCVWWGVAGLRRSAEPPDTVAARAERLAGLHYRNDARLGRYYIPAAAVLSRTPDGAQVAFLHYGMVGGDEVNIDDFLSTYRLPRAGSPAPLPEDLRTALPGDEPAEGVLLPEGQPGRQVFVVEHPGERPGAADVYVRATGS
ncbi:hypothetical protein ACFC1T_04880 [Kitasatospora sp. NPDC056076]|uniref:hypothetical protein n=1 Tax=unclassified Kitasatospora TaxID=2633591 RepID=UPI0035E06DBF